MRTGFKCYKCGEVLETRNELVDHWLKRRHRKEVDEERSK